MNGDLSFSFNERILKILFHKNKEQILELIQLHESQIEKIEEVKNNYKDNVYFKNLLEEKNNLVKDSELIKEFFN